jgi:hypothetical protein
METITQNETDGKNRGTPRPCDTTVDVDRATTIQRIDRTLEEMLQRINLLETACMGHFDNSLDEWTFRRPLGDLIKCTDEIHEALKELRADVPRTEADGLKPMPPTRKDVVIWIDGMGESLTLMHDSIANVARQSRALQDGLLEMPLEDRIRHHGYLTGHALECFERANDIGGQLALLRDFCKGTVS